MCLKYDATVYPVKIFNGYLNIKSESDAACVQNIMQQFILRDEILTNTFHNSYKYISNTLQNSYKYKFQLIEIHFKNSNYTIPQY